MRLIAEPQGISGRRYSIVRDGALASEISIPVFGPSTAAPIDGRMYRLRRAGVLRERYTLEVASMAAPVASMTQTDALRRDYAVEVGALRLRLRAEPPLRSGYLLLEGDRLVGALRPAGPLRRGVEADLPDDLPLEAGVFLVWVILLLWRGRRVTRA